MLELAATRGRATRPDIKLGICGEHGGDRASFAFCEKVGLDYVSASPYRVPIAKLAAAQTALSRIEDWGVNVWAHCHPSIIRTTTTIANNSVIAFTVSVT